MAKKDQSKGKVIDFPAKKEETFDFRDFALAIAGKDLTKAQKIAAGLLGIDAVAAEKATEFFLNKYNTIPGFMQEAQKLREAIEQGQSNNALLILYECFNLQGPIAIAAFTNLSNRAKKTSS